MREPEMHYLVQKMSLSYQSKVDNNDSAKINVLSQGTVDNCRSDTSVISPHSVGSNSGSILCNDGD
jgi:hypothetical protein